jgi:hypothetical protein
LPEAGASETSTAKIKANTIPKKIFHLIFKLLCQLCRKGKLPTKILSSLHYVYYTSHLSVKNLRVFQK